MLGCAGNNGGNALDWARTLFGPFGERTSTAPIFLPMLRGERSPDWNPALRASFHDVDASTSIDGFRQAVAEGVVFNLAQYLEILQNTTGVPPRQVVISGNGFHEAYVASALATVVKADVLRPRSFGVATSRGLAMTAWRAIGRDVGAAMEALLAGASRVSPLEDAAIERRFARYKQLRARVPEL